MKQVSGDLIQLFEDGQFDVIIHGCNCFCTMGAGIARTIKERFPEAYEADLLTTPGDRNKLGTYTKATITINSKQLHIINAYTQYDWRGKGINADYEAIRSVFSRIRSDFPNARTGYPLIGAGLARGDWGLISKIIDEELHGMDHTLVRFAQER